MERLPIDILAGSPDLREGIEAGRTTAEIAEAGDAEGKSVRADSRRVSVVPVTAGHRPVWSVTWTDTNAEGR